MSWSLQKYKCLWGVGGKGGIQVFRRDLYTHIHLDLDRVKFLSCIYKKKKKKREAIYVQSINFSLIKSFEN